MHSSTVPTPPATLQATNTSPAPTQAQSTATSTPPRDARPSFVFVVVAVVFVVLPAPSPILNDDKMSAATLVANSRSAPRCAPRALPQDDLRAGAPQCPRLPGSSPQGSSAFVECPPAPLPQDRPNGSQQQPPHPEPEGAPPVLGRTAAKNTRPKCFEQR